MDKIIELQTQEPTQFEELGLPIAIKRLAWERSSSLFVKVVSPHAEAYIASEYSPKMIQASQQVGCFCHCFCCCVVVALMLLIVAIVCIMLIAIAITIDVDAVADIAVHVVASSGVLAPQYSDPRVA